jgi:galactose mutarotase-like enzyme
MRVNNQGNKRGAGKPEKYAKNDAFFARKMVFGVTIFAIFIFLAFPSAFHLLRSSSGLMEPLDYHGQRILQWRVGPSTFRAWPEAGARLMDWQIALAAGQPRPVIHWPDNPDLANPAKIRGGNPILFPFVARTFDQGSLGFWRAADGVHRPMPMHGFARDGRFALARADATGFTAVLEPSPAAREAYPFDYQFAVTYEFSELSFWVHLELANHSAEPIPWCAGHHFYFHLPWHPQLTRADYALHIPAKKAFHHAADGHLELEKNVAPESTFADPVNVDLIRCKLKSNLIRFGPKSDEEDIKIRVGHEHVPPPWTSIVTWTENDTSPFYCVEPWMGPPNAPEHKNGLHFVSPGATEKFSVEVSLL